MSQFWAQQKPGAMAYVFLDSNGKEQKLTYLALHQGATKIAGILQASYERGDRALLLYPPGLDFIMGFLGCLYSGLIPVPAYHPEPGRLNRTIERLALILEDSQSQCVLSNSNVFKQWRRMQSAQALKFLSHLPIVGSHISKALGSHVSIQQEWVITDEISRHEPYTPVGIVGTDIAMIQYTSGSTGEPKGVVLSHANILANEAMIAETFGHDAQSIVLGWLPMYHDMGLIGNILQPLYMGIPSILLGPQTFLQNPIIWLRSMSKYKATTSGGPNFAYEICCRKISDAMKADLDLSSWKVAFNGSEPVRASTMRKFTAAFQAYGFQPSAWLPCYGLAEASLLVTGIHQAQSVWLDRSQLDQGQAVIVQEKIESSGPRNEFVSHGTPDPRLTVRIVNPETKAICPEHEIGEIWVHGPSVALKYWKKPDVTKAIFQESLAQEPGTFLRTGDLGFWHNHELFITGRIKDCIIIRGRNFYPQDMEALVEKWLCLLLRAGCGAAFSIEVEDSEQLVIAYEVQESAILGMVNPPKVLNDQQKAMLDNACDLIITRMRQHITQEYGISPYAIVLLRPHQILKTTSGKIQRQSCKKAYLQKTWEILAEFKAAQIAELADPKLLPMFWNAHRSYQIQWVESYLAEQIQQKLGMQGNTIVLDQKLAELGLDSVCLAQLQQTIQEIFGVELKFEECWQYTIAELAALIVDHLPKTPPESQDLQGKADQTKPIKPITPSPFRATLDQQAMYIQEQSMRKSIQAANDPEVARQIGLYNLSRSMKIQGRLNIPAFCNAWQFLYERHHALRSFFVLQDEQLWQHTAPSATLSIQILDNSEDWQARVQEAISSPFILDQAPLLRILLVKLGPETYRLTVVVHHLIVDFRSLEILWHELSLAYTAYQKGKIPLFQPVGTYFQEFAQAQAEFIASDAGKALHHIAQEKLREPLPILELPVDFPRLDQPTYDGAAYAWQLDAEQTKSLCSFAQTHLVSCYSVLMAGFLILLHRYTHQSKIMVGSTGLGRTQAKFQDLVGYCVHPIPILIDLDPGMSVLTLVQQVHAQIVGALDNQNIPLPYVLKDMVIPRRPGFVTLFQTMLIFLANANPDSADLLALALEQEAATLPLADLQCQPIRMSQPIAINDLTLTLAIVKDQLIAHWVANARLFSSPTIQWMQQNFATLLSRMVQQPNESLCQIQILHPQQLQQIMAWNQTKTCFSQTNVLESFFTQCQRSPETCFSQVNVLESFFTQCQRSPNHIALQFQEQTCTYAELERAVNTWSRYLAHQGVCSGDLVGIYLPRSMDMVIALLAVLRAGAAYLPLDIGLPKARIFAMIAQSQAKWMISSQELQESFVTEQSFATEQLHARWILSDLARQTQASDLDKQTQASGLHKETQASGLAQQTQASDLDKQTQASDLDKQTQASDLDKQTQASGLAQRAFMDIALPMPDPKALAYVIYTSGSTGSPKDVAIAHQSLSNALFAFQRMFNIQANDIVLAITTLSFDIALVELVLPLLYGARVVICPSNIAHNAEELCSLIEKIHPTVMQATPTTWKMLLATGWQAGPNLQILCGGEPLSLELAQELQKYGSRVFNLYGPTETTIWSSVQLLEPGTRRISIGKPIANTQIFIVDALGNMVPPGVFGEIMIAGTGLAQGYHRAPHLTAEKFLPCAWTNPGEQMYCTGDIGRYWYDGTLEIVGRSDHQVKIRGYRIELSEIEHWIKQYPEIQDAVVVVQNIAQNPGLFGYVIPGDHAPCIEKLIPELQAFLQQHLPDYMIPGQWQILSEFPKTSNAKVDRKALQEQAKNKACFYTLDASQAGNPVQECLAKIWSDVLHGYSGFFHGSFFESGGNSLNAIQVIARIRQVFQIECSLADFFAHPRLADMALWIQQQKQTGAEPPIMPLGSEQGKAHLPLSLEQSRIWFLQQYEPLSSGYHIFASFAIHGNLNISALESGFQALIKRHEILRTVFDQEHGVPYANVLEMINFRVNVVTMGNGSADSIHAVLQKCFHEPFDLKTGPLLRVVVIELSPNKAVLGICIHHLISDGWSLRLMMQELQTLYDAQGQDVHAAAPGLQYKDFVAWQMQQIKSNVWKSELEYWQKQLSGELPELKLWYDYAPSSGTKPRGAKVTQSMPKEFLDQFNVFSQSRQLTLFMAITAGLGILLHRYTGQTDLLLGMPIAGRDRPEMEGIHGFFVNTVVLRLRIDPEMSLTEYFNHVRQTALDAYLNSRIPFAKVMEMIQPGHKAQGKPVFSVFINGLDFDEAQFALPGLMVEPLPWTEFFPKFDLTLYVQNRTQSAMKSHAFTKSRADDVDKNAEDADASRADDVDKNAEDADASHADDVDASRADDVELSLLYSQDCFMQKTMERMLHQLVCGLQDMVQHPARQIQDVQFQSEEEQKEMIACFNEDLSHRLCFVPNPKFELHGRQVVEWLDHAFLRFSREIAVEWGDQTYTYQAIREIRDQIILALGQGLANPKVVVLLENKMHFVASLLAILKAGYIFVPLNPSFPGQRLAQIIALLGPACIITEQRQFGLLEQMQLGDSIKLIVAEPFKGLGLEPPFSHAVVWTKFAGLPIPDQIPRPEPCYLYYTSGSTAAPKAILGKMAGLSHFLRWEIETLGLEAGVRISQITMPHVDVVLRDVLAPLCVGGTVCIPADEVQILDIAWLCNWIRQTNVEVLHCVPSLFSAIMANHRKERLMNQLRAILMAGEVLSPADVAQCYHLYENQITLYNLYGATETNLVKFSHQVCAEDVQRGFIPAGKPMHAVRAIILDDDLRPVPVGMPGEIYIRTPYLSLGYDGQPELTKQIFMQNPFSQDSQDIVYKTGDLGICLSDGNYRFLGRKDQQIKIHGIRIEPLEIELMILQQHPQIQQALVLLIPEKNILIAYLVKQQPDPSLVGQQPDPSLVGQQPDPSLVGQQPDPSLVKQQPDPSLVKQQPDPSPSEIMANLKNSLPWYMIPQDFIFVPEFPRLPGGKLDRAGLHHRYLDQARNQTGTGISTPGQQQMPANSLEAALCIMWSQVLQRPQVGIHEHFFELGGHSLMITQVLAMLQEYFGITVPIRTFFHHPTVATLAAAILQNSQDPKKILETAQVFVEVSALSEQETQSRLQ